MTTKFKNTRKPVRNFLLEPRFQLRYVLYFFLFGLFTALQVQWMIFDRIRDSIAAYYAGGKSASEASGEIINWLDPGMVTVGWPLAAFLGVYLGLCTFFGIYITRQVSGPKLAIKRHIKELKQGNYGMRLFLRPHDELQDIAKELNELSAKLQADERQHNSKRRQATQLEDTEKSVKRVS